MSQNHSYTQKISPTFEGFSRVGSGRGHENGAREGSSLGLSRILKVLFG